MNYRMVQNFDRENIEAIYQYFPYQNFPFMLLTADEYVIWLPLKKNYISEPTTVHSMVSL